MERRTAFVTGGAKGIGRAIVRRLAQEGFSVAIGYLTSEREATELVAALQAEEINALAVRADMSDYAQAKRAYDVIRKHFGYVDTLVNNAGVSLIKPLYACDERDYDKVVDCDLRSVYNACKLFAPDMTSEGFGRIVNIGSVWGETGASAETIYSAAKAGVIGFTKALNAELAAGGVIVNCVSPGFIDTDMNGELTDDERREFLQKVPLARAGTPEEVADVVELLVRKELYIAGADIPVNGGLYR